MILVVSYPGEDHTSAVVTQLVARGAEVVQIDLSDFPARRTVALSWTGTASNGSGPSLLVRTAEGEVDLADTNVVWWRRLRGYEIDAAITRPLERVFAESETTQTVGGMLDSLNCAWVNPRRADEAAHQKPYQWTVARQVRLTVPRTLVTTDPDAARAFIDATGPTVFKSLLASADWRETRLVDASDLDRLDSVRYAPVIFQEYVPGVDLRITVVGEEVFAAEIDATATSYPVDMRMVVGESKVAPVELPPKLRDTLLALMARLGLVYGAIDMRRTETGDYYFLEVNPAGLWLFVEQLTGLPITSAMVDRLAALDDAR